MRKKQCHICETEIIQAYRIKNTSGKQWIFVCGKCCVKMKKGDFYIYGGTWKANKK